MRTWRNACWPPGFPPFATNHDLNIEFYFRFTQLTHGIRRAGSAALDLCSVAAGRFDGFWELKLNPWDKAAGTLLVTEAGGAVTGITGKPFNLLGDDVFASNGLVHDQMLRVFSEILEQRWRTLVRCQGERQVSQFRCHSEFREVQIGWNPKTAEIPQAQGADHTFSEQPRKPSRRFCLFA